MQLLVGGAAQGKRALALSRLQQSEQAIWDGADCPLEQIPQNLAVLDHLHTLVYRLLQKKLDPQDYILRLVEQNPQIVLISDEIGCGVVPIDPFERTWREQTGRICCLLAEKADRVERICMGFSTLLKESKPCESI